MGNYWRKRFEMLEKKSNEYGLDAFRQIEPTFIKAEKEIQKEIESWYGRYARNNNITMTEARRQLSTKELKEFRWDVKEYIKYGRENAIDQRWMKQLENASARVHINRLEALKIRTQQAAEVAFGNELNVIDAMARKVYTEDYYHSIFEMQKGFGVGWEIGQVDERKLGQLISKPWAADGKNFSQRIWNHRDQLVNELHTQMTRACILGEPPKKAIDTIAKKFNTTKNQAGRLVMTEQAFFHSAAQKDAFKELEVEEFEVVATLDSSTSDICQDMDGQHFPMSEYEPGVTAPPFHVWCRSVTAPYFEDNYGGERAARDVDGKTYYVPDNMKYKDWKEHFVDKTKNPEDWLKPVKDVVSGKTSNFIPTDTIDKAETTDDVDLKEYKTLSNYDQSIEWAKDDLDSHLEFCRGLPKKYHAPFDTFESEIPKYEKQLSNAFKKFDFATNTDSIAIEHILKDKKFKSFVETKTTNGYKDLTMRKDATKQLFSLWDDELELGVSQFEKYGYLGKADRAKSLYGNCRIVFKKEKLWDRTTFTVGDSLESLNDGSRKIPSLVSKPKIVSNGTNIFSENMPDINNTVINAIQKRFDSIEENGYFQGMMNAEDYVELQFHGEITLDDIAYIEVPKSSKNLDVIQELAKKYKVKIKVTR